MEFTKILLEKLGHILQRNEFRVMEHRPNYIELRSPKIILTIAYVEREISIVTHIGRRATAVYPLTNVSAKAVFNSNLKLSEVTREEYIENIFQFFEHEGNGLISGNDSVLLSFEKFIEQENAEYTKNLQVRQNLAIADRAWSERKYKEFVKVIHRINMQDLPESYQLKLKIAKKNQ